MSRICGIIYFDGTSVKKEEIQKMLDSMQNMNDDMQNVWVEKNVGFGHNMFCTTPESLHESQPLISQNGNVILTSDSRIDNRDKLFERFEINEDNFDIVTDIDLILWAYEKWGKECVQYLIGDFSFALWDVKRQELICSRDRLESDHFIFI